METTQQNNDEIEIDLLELLHVLWSKALVIFLTAAAAGLAVMLVTQLFLTPRYQSTTKMYILTKQNSDTLTSSDLQASEQLTQDCAQMIRSRQVAEAVISNLNLDMKVRTAGENFGRDVHGHADHHDPCGGQRSVSGLQHRQFGQRSCGA